MLRLVIGMQLNPVLQGLAAGPHGSMHRPDVAPCENVTQTSSFAQGVDWSQVVQVPPGAVGVEQVPLSGMQALLPPLS